jgi:hypothetical protein
LLYQGAATGERLPIGSSGQVLKVSSGGIPEWGAESGAVSSVAGRTGAVVLAVADVADAVATSDARLSDARTPSSTLAHASTHHTGGTDALAAHQLNGQTIFATGSATYSTDQTLTASRALQLTVTNTNAGGIALTLPVASNGTLNGDTLVVFGGGVSGPITIRRANLLSPLIYGTLATITSTGQQFRFRAAGGDTGNWSLVPVDTHTHTGSQVNVGTTANLPLKTGTNGVIEAGAFGTSAASFCEGNDARLSDDRDPNLHAASHLPDGADELFDQSLNSADSPTFAKITISGDEINGTAGAIHYRFTSEDPISNEATPYFAVESYDQDTEARVGSVILGVRVDKAFIQGGDADFRIEQDGGSLANINMANAKLGDAVNEYIAEIDVQDKLSDDVTLTIPDQSGTIAVVTDIPTTASDIGAAASGSITTSGLTQATARILGRTTASTGAVEEIQIGSGLSLSAGELSATGGSGGGEVRSDFVSPYTYTGLADAGTSESTASWTIRRSEFDAGGSFVATLTASAVEWDDRLTASYS